MVLEKPLGHDLASNRAINEAVRKVLSEKQIFRIDHYLGKPSVQNLFAMRFGNALFEPVWRREHIANIQITIAEDLGVEKRGAFYDQTGALRDMVQNHALQLLCALAMEPPINAHADAIRDEKLKVLRSLKPWTPESAGPARGARPVHRRHGLRRARAGLPRRAGRGSRTAAPRPSWRCAPRSPTGAGPACPSTSAPASGWPRARRTSWSTSADAARHLPRAARAVNRLVINLQPKRRAGAAHARAGAGQPPAQTAQTLAPVHLDLDFDKRFGSERVGAYERLLLDVIAGRLNLFVRSDEQEEAWRWVEPHHRELGATTARPAPLCGGHLGPERVERDDRARRLRLGRGAVTPPPAGHSVERLAERRFQDALISSRAPARATARP
jgi:glucose-6-phosphate 1-dehydrogenase